MPTPLIFVLMEQKTYDSLESSHKIIGTLKIQKMAKSAICVAKSAVLNQTFCI